MKHPRFVHYWRDLWNPRNVMAEGFARRTHQHSPAATQAALMKIEQERQDNMPPFWQSYLDLAMHIGMLVSVVIFVVNGLLFAD